MGLFDFFGKKNPQSAVAKHAARIADKRSMAPDRWEAIHALIKLEGEEVVEALLPRFTYYADPTITDHEEKETIFNAIVTRGAVAEGPIRRFAQKAESLSWPLKMLDRILSPEQVLAWLLELLSKMDTEYERDPQRKLQVLAELEQRQGAGIVEAVLPFFDDVNETARFHAIGAALNQADAEAASERLQALLAKEESMRIKARVLEGFADKGWLLSSEQAGRLPDGWVLDNGKPSKR